VYCGGSTGRAWKKPAVEEEAENGCCIMLAYATPMTLEN
jgi:hypothetical protein